MTVDTSTVAESQEDQPTAPLEGTPQESPEDSSPRDLEAARQQRLEIAALRRRLKDRESELEHHRSAGLSELEKAQRRIQELEARDAEYQQAQRTRALERLFAAEHAQYPELLTAQIDPQELDLAPDGTITNGSAVVSRLKKQYPGLFRAPSVDAGTTATGAPAVDMNDIIRQHLRRR